MGKPLPLPFYRVCHSATKQTTAMTHDRPLAITPNTITNSVTSQHIQLPALYFETSAS